MDIKKNYFEVAGNVVRRWNTFDSGNAILLFSDPRGGSTWLTEILMKAINPAVIWEPLSPGINSEFKKLGFPPRQFIPEEDEWPEAKEAFQELFSR